MLLLLGSGRGRTMWHGLFQKVSGWITCIGLCELAASVGRRAQEACDRAALPKLPVHPVAGIAR